MKRIFSFFMLLLAFYATEAQTYNGSNSLGRIAFVLYSQDEKGFFKKQENISLQEVSGVVTNYGYNNKSHELYLLTDRANCVVTVNKDLAKILKKSKSIPQLKDKDVAEVSMQRSKELDEKFEKLNAARTKQIEDSIAQAKADSIENVRRKAEEAKKVLEYRKKHDWEWVPIGKEELKCSLCDKSIKNKDSLFVVAILNDTIFYGDLEFGKLDISYVQYHMTPIPKKLKKNQGFTYHIDAFADSLALKSYFNQGFVEYMNGHNYLRYIENLKKEAPYGFIDSWSWNDKYSMVTMYLKYVNTHKKTIKYIDVHFKITNDVGDVRKTGVFKGTGPIEEYESGSWDWDSSSYYVARDASNMYITQIVLTYMDGTKKVLPKGQIIFN